MSEINCLYCKRNKVLSSIFSSNYQIDKKGFENDLCDLCNLNIKLFDKRKVVNEFDIKKINFILFMLDKFKDYYNDERRIQQNDNILIWKNDKYLKDWYMNKYKRIENFKQFKITFYTYFDNKGHFVKDNLCINLKNINDKCIIKWLDINYFNLKNEINWC